MASWMNRLALALGLAALATGAVCGTAAADAIGDIRQRGKLLAGVTTDYAPYGFLDSGGRIAGIEPELAQDVAEVLGVALELVPLGSASPAELLEGDEVDLVIATLTDTQERREVVRIVEPNYYASGTNILTRGDFARWEDLGGAPVCGIQGAVYNRRAAEEFGAEIVAFKGTTEALTALRQNRCVAFVYEEAFIVSRLAASDWEGWKMPLPTVDDAPWGIAVKEGEAALANLVSGVIVGWHLSGRILALEEKYGLQPTPFARNMHELFLGINPGITR